MTGKEPASRTEATPVPRETAYSPFYALQRRINRDFDALFNRFFSDEWPAWPSESEIGPRINVSEKDGVIQVEAEVPGLESKDLEVSVNENILTLKGEHREEKEEKGKEMIRKEFSCKSFQRSIALPARVQAEKAEASFDKGILKLKLPMAQEDRERVKKIPIKAA
jgi:HSP20 family protein